MQNLQYNPIIALRNWPLNYDDTRLISKNG